jgi:hypothetical protein
MNEKNLRQEVDNLVMQYMDNKKDQDINKKGRSVQPMRRMIDTGIERDRNVD